MTDKSTNDTVNNTVNMNPSTSSTPVVATRNIVNNNASIINTTTSPVTTMSNNNNITDDFIGTGTDIGSTTTNDFINSIAASIAVISTNNINTDPTTTSSNNNNGTMTPLTTNTAPAKVVNISEAQKTFIKNIKTGFHKGQSKVSNCMCDVVYNPATYCGGKPILDHFYLKKVYAFVPHLQFGGLAVSY